MPAFVLAEGPRTVARFDVVAAYSEGTPLFICHVALHNADTSELSDGQDDNVVHMGPPLAMRRRIKARAVGSVPLTNDEIKGVESWIAEVADEYQWERADRWQQFVIDPPWKDEADPITGVRRYRRFSCAGFVLDAHRQVDIELLVIDRQTLPEVDVATLRSAYPRFNPRSGSDFGLDGNGPWRVVLAGYVLHALARGSDEIRLAPYRAKPGDELF